jgi:hypothetical protein
LVSDRVDDAEHILGAMPMKLTTSRSRPAPQDEQAPGLHPANLTIPPPEPELRRGSLRLGEVERSVVGRPNLFDIVWMHSIHELFDGAAPRRQLLRWRSRQLGSRVASSGCRPR